MSTTDRRPQPAPVTRSAPRAPTPACCWTAYASAAASTTSTPPASPTPSTLSSTPGWWTTSGAATPCAPSPRLPLVVDRLPGIDGHPGRDLGLAWIWARLTHGPAFTSPRPFIADRHVRAFDAAIDPETHLALAETGQQLLADADVITIPTTHATWAAVTRRYG